MQFDFKSYAAGLWNRQKGKGDPVFNEWIIHAVSLQPGVDNVHIKFRINDPDKPTWLPEVFEVDIPVRMYWILSGLRGLWPMNEFGPVPGPIQAYKWERGNDYGEGSQIRCVLADYFNYQMFLEFREVALPEEVPMPTIEDYKAINREYLTDDEREALYHHYAEMHGKSNEWTKQDIYYRFHGKV